MIGAIVSVVMIGILSANLLLQLLFGGGDPVEKELKSIDARLERMERR